MVHDSSWGLKDVFGSSAAKVSLGLVPTMTLKFVVKIARRIAAGAKKGDVL